MNDFINVRDWPLVGLHMPERVPDEQADTLMAQLEALYARAEPHVLLMDGAQQPRQSARFMAAYIRWSRENFDLQQRYCLGAVRIVEDEALRRETARKANAWNASGQAPYPYRIVATRDEARAQAHAWIAEPPARTVPTAPAQAR
ncbi:hypothetical protein D5045_24385 [Verminephrobacter eiseniae]|uniref:hypothetical protein n=1 Tax=Verminephrobacter eiseniae TaxID=364317 RepID=UPI00223764C9|nr:hypothetical protein [Verminephrobacter eiseniae]MCW5263156.1 hypothetical protein [Verminephrobacter eiseniae]